MLAAAVGCAGSTKTTPIRSSWTAAARNIPFAMGAERKKAIYILVQASDLNQAAKNLAEGMRGTVSDYEVASIVKTPIVDAYKIAEK